MNDGSVDGAGVVADDHGAVRVITIRRPEKRNALDLEDRRRLLELLHLGMAEARSIVLTGAGGFFCAGGDIGAMTNDPQTSAVRLDILNRIARGLVRSPVPVIAAVEGPAFGMGLALACGSDYVVSARGARYEASFARIGLGPDTGLSWTLPRRIGDVRARQMITMLRRFSGDEALAVGLVDEVVADGVALSRALEVASDAAALPCDTVSRAKRLLLRDLGAFETALAAEAQLQIRLLASPESMRLREDFLERSSREAGRP